jgi:hypothetical protein
MGKDRESVLNPSALLLRLFREQMLYKVISSRPTEQRAGCTQVKHVLEILSAPAKAGFSCPQPPYIDMDLIYIL